MVIVGVVENASNMSWYFRTWVSSTVFRAADNSIYTLPMFIDRRYLGKVIQGRVETFPRPLYSSKWGCLFHGSLIIDDDFEVLTKDDENPNE